MAGFITGLGIEVLTRQAIKIFGVSHSAGSGFGALAEQLHATMSTSIDTTGYFVELINLLQSITHANLYTVSIGLGAFLALRIMKKYTPKAPAALITLTLMTVIVAVFGLDNKGVKVLGAMPSGLPSLTLPSITLSEYLRLLPGAIAVVGITLCEALLLVRNCDRKHNTKSDGNQVLFAYGMTSIASGVTGSLILGPSASRTAAMDAAGSRTQLSSLVAAGTIGLVMIFFTKQLASLPTAALAGVVASAVLNLIEIKELRELWQMRRSEFWTAIVCLLSVLVFGPLQAVIIAFLMSTIDLLRRASRPRTWVLQEAPDGSHFVSEKINAVLDTSGIIFFRFGAALYFANATFFEEEIKKLFTSAVVPVKWLVLDMQSVNDMDTTGAETMHQVMTWLASQGVNVAASRVSPSLATLLQHYHLNDVIKEKLTYPTNRHAIAAIRKEAGQTTPFRGCSANNPLHPNEGLT